MHILQQYRFNISLPQRLQSQQPILEKLGTMVALLNWFQYERLPQIHESILFGILRNTLNICDDAIAINYCMQNILFTEKN